MGQRWIVIGLGNPGTRYARTRHNIGFWAVDRLAERHDASWSMAEKLGRIARGEQGSASFVLIKPRTYMNRVGRAAAAACRAFDVAPDHLVAVCDDADLELGRIRIRATGSAGGHNGLRSLIDALGTDSFARVKLGVRGRERAGAELADYVLEPFATEERALAEELADLGAGAVEMLVTHGLSEAMNRYNAVRAGAEPRGAPG